MVKVRSEWDKIRGEIFELYHSPRLVMASFVGLFVVIGLASILLSHAASNTATVTASSGTLSGCATSVSDSSASSGTAVKFSSCSTTDPSTLDASGATIPSTSYAIPSGSIYMATNGSDNNSGTITAPVASINKAAALVPDGGTIVMRGGTYRDWVNTSGALGTISKSVTIQAYPGEQVWFDGADVEPAGNWTNDGNGQWSMSWNTPSFCSAKYYTVPYDAQNSNNTGPCAHYDMYYSSTSSSVVTAISDPQQVFVNGTPMHEVTTLAAATGGAYYYDQSNKVMYISTDPSTSTIELAARPSAMILNGANSKVLGIGFKDYASNEYNNSTEGALFAGNSGDTFQNDVFTGNSGGGLGVGDPTNAVIDHSVFANNGFDGIESNGHEHSGGAIDDFILENSVLNNNNARQFGYFCSTSCSQAGMKMAHMDGFTVTNNIIENNQNAHGVWCDEACTNGKYIYNLVENNGKSGLFYEISSTGIIASNMVIGNHNWGIRVGSATTEVYNNTLLNNTGTEQLWIYDDARSPSASATDVGPDTYNVSVVNNLISGSVPAAWAYGTNQTATDTYPALSNFFSTIDYNAYYQSSGSGQLLWDWQSALSPTPIQNYYYNVSNFTAAHPPFDAHSIYVDSGSDPFFVDVAAGNYNVRSGSPAYKAATALPSDVQQALGLGSATGYSIGAISWPK